MKIDSLSPAREFRVGYHEIVLNHVATIELEPDEMITFSNGSDKEYDVVRKNWGYYATPSLAGRLRSFGFRPALMRNKNSRHCFVVLVEEDQIEAWRQYMTAEQQELILWLDDFETLSAMPAVEEGTN